MKRFLFRLEKVLRLRQQETDQSRRALGQALAVEADARRAVDEAAAALQARLTEVRHKEHAGVTAFDFAALRTHVQYLQRGRDAAEAALAEAQALTHRRRDELLAARKKEKALEKLRERRLVQYTQEALAEEQKELDAYGDRKGLNTAASRSDI